ncbi:hypothetical protein [Novosphingobium endophyticum]|uniref:hypothetical protein n=1 Tax=Novosphingobium endophyticum TaxID=1955250 RepID=UPI001E4192D1|nr:hypothetical protein [Novosphingobium endophyticum]
MLQIAAKTFENLVRSIEHGRQPSGNDLCLAKHRDQSGHRRTVTAAQRVAARLKLQKPPHEALIDGARIDIMIGQPPAKKNKQVERAAGVILVITVAEQAICIEVDPVSERSRSQAPHETTAAQMFFKGHRFLLFAKC